MPLQFAAEFTRVIRTVMLNASSLSAEVLPNGDVCISVDLPPAATQLKICVDSTAVTGFKKLTMAKQDEAVERLFTYLSDKYDSLRSALNTKPANNKDTHPTWNVTTANFLDAPTVA